MEMLNDIPIPATQVGIKFLSGVLFDPVNRPPAGREDQTVGERTAEIVGWGVEIFQRLKSGGLDYSGKITYEDVADLANELRISGTAVPKICPVVYTRGLVFLRETPDPTTRESMLMFMHRDHPGRTARVSKRDTSYIRLAIGSRLGRDHWETNGLRYLNELFSD